MAFLEVIGELFGFSDRKGWSLVGQDAGFTTEFKGQFLAESMAESIGSNLGETTSINKGAPDFQWLNGESEVFTLRVRIFAQDSFKNIKQQVELLKSFTRRQSSLRRAPKFLFTAGTEIGFTCFVRGARFAYDELRSDGSLRGAVVDLTLQKIDETITQNAATGLAAQIKFAVGVIAGAAGIANQLGRVVNIPGGSLHTIDRTVEVKQGHTFESIAKREYGDALLGDILRRVQPDLEPLQPGARVQLVEASEIGTIRVTPQSVALKATVENAALKEEFFELRDRSTTIFV